MATMNATFAYNSTNVQPAVQPSAPAFYNVPSSGFQLYNHYATANGAPVLQNGALTSIAQTAFTNVVSSTRAYQQPTHGIMHNHIDQYQNPASRMTVTDEDDDSASESRTPNQSDQQVSGPMQNRKRRRGVIEKRRRDRINSSLAELRRLVPAALEKQGSQKLEKAEILQMTVDHLRFLNSKGLDALWRDQQRYATEYYSMGFRVCISEVDAFLSKEGMDMNEPLRLRLMSHLQCVSVQRQSAFNVWTTTNQHRLGDQYQHVTNQSAYWTPATATVSQASIYGVLPTSEVMYSSQSIQSMIPTSSTTGQNGLATAQAPITSYANGNSAMMFAPTTSVSNAATLNSSVNGSGY